MNKEMIKSCDVKTELTVKYKCSCSIFMPVYVDKIICRWCGNWVYRTDKAKFKEKLKKVLKNA